MMLYLLALALTRIIYASVNPSAGWDPELIKLARPIMNIIVKERLNVDLFAPSFDYQFQNELMNYKNPEWYSQKSNKTSSFPTVVDPNGTISLNAYYVLDEPGMKFWRRYGYRYLFSYSKKSKLKNILAVGRTCYQPFQCSKEFFTNFVSCIDLKNDKKCSRSNLYYPRVYDIRLSRISCIPSGKIIICYGRRWQDYNDDYPYNDNTN